MRGSCSGLEGTLEPGTFYGCVLTAGCACLRIPTTYSMLHDIPFLVSHYYLYNVRV